MLFMNEYDVMRAIGAYGGHPVLGPAVQTLVNLVNWTNCNSDGWAYWPKPCRAAKQLQQLLVGDGKWAAEERQKATVTADDVRKALRPIKAFRTRQGADFEIVEP
jgi:hypothetical protein